MLIKNVGIIFVKGHDIKVYALVIHNSVTITVLRLYFLDSLELVDSANWLVFVIGFVSILTLALLLGAGIARLFWR